jgi:hypothetical protein
MGRPPNGISTLGKYERYHTSSLEKRVNCDSEDWVKIITEVDDFLVKLEEDIVSFIYNLEDERNGKYSWGINLHEFISPKKIIKLDSLKTETEQSKRTIDSVMKIISKKMAQDLFRSETKNENLHYFEIENISGEIGNLIKNLNMVEADSILKINNLKK